MDIINEAYKTSQQLTHLREAGAAEDKLVIDMIKNLREGNFSYGSGGAIKDFVDKFNLRGSTNFNFGKVKNAKSFLSKVHPGLISYLKESLSYYAKKTHDPFSGYESFLIALDMQSDAAVFKLSDFNIKGQGEWGADRVAVSLMYGGDRLKAFEKYGNVPRGAWKKLLLKYTKNFEEYGTKEWLADDVGMPGTSDVKSVVDAVILKYKL